MIILIPWNPTELKLTKSVIIILQLVILVNLENLNAEMIEQVLPQIKRLERLNEIAREQFDILQYSSGIKKIENLDSNMPKLLGEK